MIIVVIGMTNSGKSTLSNHIKNRFGLKYDDFDRSLFINFYNSGSSDKSFKTFFNKIKNSMKFEDNCIINLYTDDILKRFLKLDHPYIKIYLDNKRCSNKDMEMMEKIFGEYFTDLDWKNFDKNKTDKDLTFNTGDSIEQFLDKLEPLLSEN